ncbi:hypothetical protein UlMin_038855 [Ulmus minor]
MYHILTPLRVFKVQVVLDNGLVELTFTNPGGDLIGIKYNGIENLLEIHNKESDRGYWDIMWNEPERETNHQDRLQGTKFDVIKSDENQIEISFTKTWNVSSGDTRFPLNVDKRYIMLRDYPGFYTYGIIEHPQGSPEMELGVVRAVFKLQQNKFQYMAISDERQRIMPSANDRKKGQPLAYPEAVLLTNPSNPDLKGEVDDKYQYSSNNKDMKVHGWMTFNPSVGFWVITPSYEFRTGGPMKQELTSHVGPTSLSVFVSAHYAGQDLVLKFKEGEAWKKVYGPVSIYLNSASIKKWPYNFPQSKDFPTSEQRGNVRGQLLIRDRYINESLISAESAHVGLAAPGEAGSCQRENKGYQFWTEANKTGHFSIKNVRPGNYSLYAWVPGFVGDYLYHEIITTEPGSEIDLDALIYDPPRNGPTLWEIGIPDRTASEFYVPDPNPTLVNRLYTNHSEKFRQYGLWDRYTDLYPEEDLIYTVGESDYRKDWFFAHVNRKSGDKTYQETTWQVIFQLDNVMRFQDYTLQLALASASLTDLQVRINNDPRSSRAMFQTHLIGRDNAIARHGIHGLYWFYSLNVPGHLLQPGNNTLFLTQSRSNGPFGGLMYDYIRFEGPPQTFAN